MANLEERVGNVFSWRDWVLGYGIYNLVTDRRRKIIDNSDN